MNFIANSSSLSLLSKSTICCLDLWADSRESFIKNLHLRTKLLSAISELLYFQKLFCFSCHLKTMESDLTKWNKYVNLCNTSRRMFNTKISRFPRVKPAVRSYLNVKHLSFRFLLLGFSCHQVKVRHSQLQRLFENIIIWDSCRKLI